ncbi:unnamed protein product [Closterium sp. Naga37s-1]|nr:unnamed protein product [Closterium sp. Naga37s-1]
MTVYLDQVNGTKALTKMPQLRQARFRDLSRAWRPGQVPPLEEPTVAANDDHERQWMQQEQEEPGQPPEELEQPPDDAEPQPREVQPQVELLEREQDAARLSPRVSPLRQHTACPQGRLADHMPRRRHNRDFPPTPHDRHVTHASPPANGYAGKNHDGAATTPAPHGAQENARERSVGPAADPQVQQQAPPGRPPLAPQSGWPPVVADTAIGDEPTAASGATGTTMASSAAMSSGTGGATPGSATAGGASGLTMTAGGPGAEGAGPVTAAGGPGSATGADKAGRRDVGASHDMRSGVGVAKTPATDGAGFGAGGTSGFIAALPEADTGGDLPLAADAAAAGFGDGHGSPAITIARREETRSRMP